jgi:methylenetetrahydrofolate reductase (NADPH)
MTLEPTAAVSTLLRGFSVELMPGDEKSISAAAETLPKGTETFIPSLPRARFDDVVAAAVRLGRAGLAPVPHIAARNLRSEAELDSLLKRLSGEAGVDRSLVIAGDRDDPRGPFSDSLHVLNSGLLQQHGIKLVYLSCYPEGHPRISSDRLAIACAAKLAAADAAGLLVGLVSQFCFESAPMIQLALQLRRQGVNRPLRIGLAGPTRPAVLLKYAMMCGVGPSIRALRDRKSVATDMMAGTTEGLVMELAHALRAEPAMGIGSVHFFTFGSLSRTLEMIARLKHREAEIA